MLLNETKVEQACLPGKSAGLGLSSASVLAVPAFLASVSGAVDRIRNIFGETHEDSSLRLLAFKVPRLVLT